MFKFQPSIAFRCRFCEYNFPIVYDNPNLLFTNRFFFSRMKLNESVRIIPYCIPCWAYGPTQLLSFESTRNKWTRTKERLDPQPDNRTNNNLKPLESKAPHSLYLTTLFIYLFFCILHDTNILKYFLYTRWIPSRWFRLEPFLLSFSN